MTAEQNLADIDVAATAAAIASLAESTSPESGEEQPPTEETQAADETADSEEEETQTEDEASVVEELEEEGPAQGSGSKLDKLIASKGGDPDKFAESIFEQMNSAAALAKENADLKAQLSKTTGLEEESEKQDEQEDPDVVSLRQDVEDIGKEVVRATASQTAIVTTLGQLEVAIAELKGEHKASDDYQKGILAAQIRDLSGKKAALEARWDELERTKPRLERSKREAERLLRQAERQVSQASAVRQQAQREAQEGQDKFRATFESTVAQRLAEYGIPEKSLAFVTKLSKNEAMAFLRSPQGDKGFITQEQLTGFINEVLKQYADDRGLTKTAAFKKASQQKLAAAGKTAVGTKPSAGAPQKPTLKQEKNPAYWSKRADMLLEGRR